MKELTAGENKFVSSEETNIAESGNAAFHPNQPSDERRSRGYPLTESGKIGWRSGKLEVYGQGALSKGIRNIGKTLEWPMEGWN